MSLDPIFLYENRRHYNDQLMNPIRLYLDNKWYLSLDPYHFSPNIENDGSDFDFNSLPIFSFRRADLDKNPRGHVETYLDIPLVMESYTIINQTLAVNMQNQPNFSGSKSPVYSSSFKDQFIYNYHSTVFENNLTSHSGSSNRLILKQTYEELLALAQVSYKTDLDNLNYNNVECFIGTHTYYRLTHIIETNEYRLNLFFTYDEHMKEVFSNLSLLKPSPHISWVTGISNDGNLIIDEVPIECPEFIHESFYPWLGVKEDGTPLTLDEYIDSYINSNESVLLLYGEKGQGKSTLLKYLLHKSGSSATITYQDNIADLDILFSQFMRSEDKILIIEDAETFLTKRESGNSSMRRLLNIADGLTSRKDKKVIFTTNLSSLNHIDDALLRDGRCYDAVKFEVFTKQESENIADVLNINRNLLVKDEYILAELFSINNNKLKRKKLRGNAIVLERPRTGIGFSPK